MKMKKKAVIAAAAFAVAMNLSACAYGPPQEEYVDTTNTEEEISYDPADNINEDVYGPPPEMWENDETDIPEEEQDVGEGTLKNE